MKTIRDFRFHRRWRAAAALTIIVTICAAFPLLTAPGARDGISQDRNAAFTPPGAAHWLGTDGFGRDELARLMRGTRASFSAGLLATGLALVCGVASGSLAGYYAGWGDHLLNGAAELFLSLPWFYLVLSVRALLPLRLSAGIALLSIAVIAGLTAWPRPFRLVRGIVMAERGRNYVLAARAFGASDFYLIRRHILPAVLPVLLVQALILLPQFVMAEVTLSFLGFGIGEPSPSLGNMIASLRNIQIATSHPWVMTPVVLLVLITACCRNLAGTLHQKASGR